MFKELVDQEEFEKDLKRFSRLVFYSNYTEIEPKQLINYFDAIQAKVKDLKLVCDFVKNDKNVKNILACYCSYQDQFNLLALDKYWNQIRVNNTFIELNKSKFQKAYKICNQIKKTLVKAQDVQEGNAALVGNQEISSDEEDIKLQKPKMTIILNNLNGLFNDNL